MQTDIEALVPLLMRSVKAVFFRRLQKPSEINWLPKQRSMSDRKTNVFL